MLAKRPAPHNLTWPATSTTSVPGFQFGLRSVFGNDLTALKGMADNLDPGPPLDKDLYVMTEEEFEAHGIQRLPRSLGEAIEIFDGDPLAKDVLGPVMHKSYSLYKHAEWERYSVHITEWEVEEYLRFF